uniref:Uncharacterized protein n=1 Tax=Mesocestoides corti TaxID=53468 RepID=A0A5K3FIF8_MESCO
MCGFVSKKRKTSHLRRDRYEKRVSDAARPTIPAPDAMVGGSKWHFVQSDSLIARFLTPFTLHQCDESADCDYSPCQTSVVCCLCASVNLRHTKKNIQLEARPTRDCGFCAGVRSQLPSVMCNTPVTVRVCANAPLPLAVNTSPRPPNLRSEPTRHRQNDPIPLPTLPLFRP